MAPECPTATTLEVVLINLPQSLLAIATLIYAARGFWAAVRTRDRVEHLPCASEGGLAAAIERREAAR